MCDWCVYVRVRVLEKTNESGCVFGWVYVCKARDREPMWVSTHMVVRCMCVCMSKSK